MDIKILVATLKKYNFPKEKIYIPVQVGKEGKENLGYLGDNEGKNISVKNKSYCELTMFYWAWKNLDCDYIGINHYRRYFLGVNYINRKLYQSGILKTEDKTSLVLTEERIKKIMKRYDVIIPKKSISKRTIFEDYKINHNANDLLKVRNVIEEVFPSYLVDFDEVMKSKKIYYWNMMIMKKEKFNQYCEWLFKILFLLEKRIDISGYDAYESRVYGFLGERLFNVWLSKQQLNYKELKVINIEEKW